MKSQGGIWYPLLRDKVCVCVWGGAHMFVNSSGLSLVSYELQRFSHRAFPTVTLLNLTIFQRLNFYKYIQVESPFFFPFY